MKPIMTLGNPTSLASVRPSTSVLPSARPAVAVAGASGTAACGNARAAVASLLVAPASPKPHTTDAPKSIMTQGVTPWAKGYRIQETESVTLDGFRGIPPRGRPV